ncbi:MAG: hypothetical protein C5B52_15040 [Bacteroidetes bacterium]|nr:MAG: hypothetical protein C5B52_15040 [Bacteroidota bacterium]
MYLDVVVIWYTMYKLIFFVVCVAGFIPVGFAQSNDREIGKILSDLNKTSDETEKANRLLELAMAYVHKPGEEKTDLDTAILLINQAAAINKNALHDKSIEAKVDYVFSSAYREKGDTATGHRYIDNAIEIYKTFPLSDEVGEAYLERTRYYNWQTPNAADFVIENLDIARKNFLKSGNQVQLGVVLKTTADWNTIKGNYGVALTEAREALNYYVAVKNIHIQDVYDLLDHIYKVLGDYPKAIEYGLLAEKTAREASDTGSVLATIYIRLADSYAGWENGNSPQALSYCEKSLAISRRINNDPNGRIIFWALVNQYTHMGRAKEASALIMGSGKDYTPASISDSLMMLPIFLNAFTKAHLLSQAKRYADVIINLQSRTVLARQYNPTNFYLALQDYFLAANRHKEAEQYAILALQCSDRASRANRATAYLGLSRVDSAQGRFQSAFEHFKQYKAINDSAYNEKKAFQFAQMQAAFNTEQKEDSLKMERQNTRILAEQNNADNARARLIRNVIIGASIFMLLLLLIAYLFKQKSNRRLMSQQQIINNKNESLTRIIEEKNQLLEEKEWLVKEIHHRVKNNLQIVTSLLSTQSNYLENEEAIQAIAESRHRMQAMSLLHQKLYQSENASSVNMQMYIHDLAEYLRASFKSDKKVDFPLHIDPIQLDIAQAIPVGLILNEAITNSFKYAFTEQSEGTLSIYMHSHQNNQISILIKDNGKGLPENFDKENSNSMGMRLMNGLIKQINGQVSVMNKDGVEIRILFTADALFKAQSGKDLKMNQPVNV